MNALATPPPAQRRLRVLQSVFAGFWELYRNFRSYLLVAVIWAVVSTAASILLFSLAALAGNGGFLGSLLPGWFSLAGAWAVWLGGAAAITRLCHRSAILGEIPSVAGGFRFDSSFWRLAGIMTGIAVAVAILLYVNLFLYASIGIFSRNVPLNAFYWLGVLVATMAASLFALALPIAATNNGRQSVRTGLTMAAGFRGRLWGVLLLASAPLTLLPIASFWLLPKIYEWLHYNSNITWLPVMALAIAIPILTNLGVALLAGAIASAHLQLAGPADRAAAPAPD